MNEGQVGDIADGHVFTDSGWLPFRYLSNQPSSPYKLGDVFNDHVYDGHSWVPIPLAEQRPPPRPSPGGGGTADLTTDDAETHAWSRRFKRQLGVAVALAVVALAGIIMVAAGADDEDPADPGTPPKRQKDFLAVIAVGQEHDPNNPVDFSLGRKDRARALCDVLPKSLAAKSWVGTVDTVDTEMMGDRAVFTVSIGNDVKVSTGGSLHGRDTLIQPSDALYRALADLDDGDPVTFSGRFVRDDDGPDCLSEFSVLDANSMQSPTFQMRFTEIR